MTLTVADFESAAPALKAYAYQWQRIMMREGDLTEEEAREAFNAYDHVENLNSIVRQVREFTEAVVAAGGSESDAAQAIALSLYRPKARA